MARKKRMQEGNSVAEHDDFVLAIVEQVEAYRPDLLLGVDLEQLGVDGAKALLAQAMQPQETAGTVPVASRPEIDLDALVQDLGLVFVDHVRREEVRNGQRISVWRQTERPMTSADVLSYREDTQGRGLVLVTADGRKLLWIGEGRAVNLLE
jgi:hypothetical protein